MFCNAITLHPLQNTSDPHPSNPWSQKKKPEVWKTGPDKLRSWFQISTECLGMEAVWGTRWGFISWKLRSSHGVSNFFATSYFLWKSLWFKACDGHSDPFFLVDRLNFNNRTRKQGMDMAILSCQIMWNPRSVSRECMNQYLPICAANYLLIPFWEGESWNTASNKPQFLDGWEVKTTRDE